VPALLAAYLALAEREARRLSGVAPNK
jgi:hypothetical protein